MGSFTIFHLIIALIVFVPVALVVYFLVKFLKRKPG